MPYQINKYNGDRLVVLEDGTLDTTTSVGLVGKNFAGYGEIQNENFLWLLENFAGTVAPGKPLAGQLWYDSAIQRVKVHNGLTWGIVGGIKASSTAPTDPASGDAWLDIDTNQLYVYNGTSFALIGPEAVLGFDTTRVVSAKVRDDSGNYWPILKATLNDTVVAIFAERDFILNSLDAITGFSAIKKGINLSATSTINGNVQGNSSTTTALQTPRLINGELFDGTGNISLTAQSPFAIISGNYINGINYDGAAEVTWDIDATPDNEDGKIVARDSSGNFRANTVIANLTGNTLGTHYGDVQGNLTGNLLGDAVGNLTGNVLGNVTGNVTGSVIGSVTGNIKGSITAQDDTPAYDGTTKTFTGTFVGNASTASKLQTARRINSVEFNGENDIVVADSTKLPLSGGTLSGQLTLNNDPTTDLEAATKRYVDNRDTFLRADILDNLPPEYYFTYANTQYSTAGYTNQVGSWNNGANFFDVYPPVGYTMSKLVAFIPSIAVIHYAGGVDGNDSLRCTWSNLGDRIRVYVQNTEQRSTPAANWLAIWRL
jgi:hypothetical protein